MLREEATVLTGMLIGLSAIDFRWGLGGSGGGVFPCQCAHPNPLTPTPNPVRPMPPAFA